jgi:hypothetical protein
VFLRSNSIHFSQRQRKTRWQSIVTRSENYDWRPWHTFEGYEKHDSIEIKKKQENTVFIKDTSPQKKNWLRQNKSHLRNLLGFFSGDNEDDPSHRSDALGCKYFEISRKKILRPSAGSKDSSTLNIILFDMTSLQQFKTTLQKFTNIFLGQWKQNILTLRNNGA